MWINPHTRCFFKQVKRNLLSVICKITTHVRVRNQKSQPAIGNRYYCWRCDKIAEG